LVKSHIKQLEDAPLERSLNGLTGVFLSPPRGAIWHQWCKNAQLFLADCRSVNIHSFRQIHAIKVTMAKIF